MILDTHGQAGQGRINELANRPGPWDDTILSFKRSAAQERH